jgi:hypothetical protein
VEWLASPEREGRGPGTAGIDAAAEWVAGQFVALGLDTSVIVEASFQPFPITLDAKLGAAEENVAEIVAPPLAEGEVRVRTGAAGICGSDVHAAQTGAWAATPAGMALMK